jgi:predicted short-subunit dehydrogenase-like oxidoreductase (DUF2520 family)
MYQYNISFAGAGRVAESLCRELFHAGFKIDKIVSQSESSGELLADTCNAEWSDSLIFPDSTGVIIVAVPDHRLKKVLSDIICSPGALVAHTAGSMGLDIFPEHIGHKGIFYPLQTFSKKRRVSFTGLPFLLESSDDESSVMLKTLVESFSGKAYFVDSDHRRLLHLAAVFVCNFTNHMLTIGKNVILKAGLPFEIMAPLINETISKALDLGPENSQTGPAVRHDQNTIEKHLELLSYSTELQRIYKEMTQSIIVYYKNPPTPLKGGARKAKVPLQGDLGGKTKEER